MNVTIDGVRYVPAPEPCENPGLLDAVGSFPDAGGDMTVREYLCALLSTLWNEGEGFSGKRPFGNSGWEFGIFKVLIREGAVEGSLDEDGYIEDMNGEAQKKANAIVFGLIGEMCRGQS